MWNHDQIARTEDFYVGTSISVRAGLASADLGSSSSALLFQSLASTGFGGTAPVPGGSPAPWAAVIATGLLCTGAAGVWLCRARHQARHAR